MIIVLINDTVKKYLLKQPKDTRKRIRDKFEFLESGIWDGGLKVKKLKGVSSKYVFEARLDRGNRILFTLGGGTTGTDRAERRLIVYVWGIVEHDDISLKSRTIIPANAPFLQFREYDETLLEEVDMEELGPAYFTQEAITERVGDESGSQRWYSIDEPEWQRIQMYTRDDFDLFLHLTPEQDEILGTPLPLMISGTAGSGKTSLAVYYLLNRNLSKKKKLFITYNKHLKDFARKLYNGLLNEREWKKEVLLPDFYTFKELCLEVAGKKQFHPEKEMDLNRFSRLFTTYPNYQSYDAALVWEEIRAIIKGAVPRVNLPVLETALRRLKKGTVKPGLVKQLQDQFILFSRLESFHKVDKLVRKYLKIDIAAFAAAMPGYLQTGSGAEREKECVSAILEKTVNTLTKYKDETGRKYLSFPEYEMLGKKKAPNFKFNRGDIYRIFEWYQQKLEAGDLWDELDMMPETTAEKYTWDILVCDEVQDLTDTQLDLLFNFVKNPKNMFLAGDTRQTVNPSGFRWEEVRNHFYERGLEVPDLKNLSLNFRSSGSIIELSNVLLELKEKFTGRKSEGPREEWKYKGRPVTVVSGINTVEMLEILKSAGAHRTILVRTETEKETLKQQLKTELVFTIKEAKGLEFDTVVLWKFCDDPLSESADVWKATLNLSDRNIHEAKVRHEISLLYVGITRCQKDLIVYDGLNPSVIWESELLKDNVYITDDRGYLRQVWEVVSSPGQWVEQGRYFFGKGHYRAAAECFRNGGAAQDLAGANARYYHQTGNYREAALNYKIAGEIQTAAVNYEKAGVYNEALVLWEQLNNPARVSQCRAALLKGEEKYMEAGRVYLETGNYEAAAACFIQAKNHRAAADIYLNHLDNSEKAALHYEYARDYSKAAELYSGMEMHDKAAELYFNQKDYPRAEALWEKTGNTKKLLELYRRTGRYDKALVIYEQENETEKAVRFLKTLKIDIVQLEDEGDELFQNKSYYQALVRFLVVDEALSVNEAARVSARIAQCYYRMDQYKESIPYYEKAGEYYTAAQVYDMVGDYENAFRLYFDTQEDEDNNFALARRALDKVTNPGFLRESALSYYYVDDYERALLLFKHLGGFAALEGFCYADEGVKEKVFACWERCRTIGEFVMIAEGCLEKELVSLGAEFFLAIPFRENPDWTPRFHLDRTPGAERKTFDRFVFTIPLENTSIVDLMKAHFMEQPGNYEKIKNEDKNVTEKRKKEMSIWGHFLMEEDIGFDNIEMITNYLEKSGDYNTLLLHFKTFKRMEPERFKETAKKVQKNTPSGKGTDSNEAIVFRRMLLGELGELTVQEGDDMNKRFPKMTVRRNNFILFLSNVVKEEYRHKARAFCAANGLGLEHDGYLDYLMDKPGKEEDKKKN